MNKIAKLFSVFALFAIVCSPLSAYGVYCWRTSQSFCYEGCKSKDLDCHETRCGGSTTGGEDYDACDATCDAEMEGCFEDCDKAHCMYVY